MVQRQGEGLRPFIGGVVGNPHHARLAALRVAKRPDRPGEGLEVGPTCGGVTRTDHGTDGHVEIGQLNGDARSRGDDFDGERHGAIFLADWVGRVGELHPYGVVVLTVHRGGVGAQHYVKVGIGPIFRQREGKGLGLLGDVIPGEGHVQALAPV